MTMLFAWALCCAAAHNDVAPSQQSVVVVIGAAGNEEFGKAFIQWGDRWKDACDTAQASCTVVGLGGTTPHRDLDAFQQILAAEKKQHSEPLWIVLIGHGTFDGRQAKFNLRGPDLTATQLSQWLEPFDRTIVIVNCASASSPFINRLAGAQRVVLTSTKSGYQYNFARFGDYLSRAIAAPDADLDKDDQTSLLEAFLQASSRVAEFYRQDARLATEEALLDDNGDGLGTPANWFRGVRAVKKAKKDAVVDGTRANQLHLVRNTRENSMPPEVRKLRDELEMQITRLRAQKPNLDADEYYRQLLPIMLKLAKLYESLE